MYGVRGSPAPLLLRDWHERDTPSRHDAATVWQDALLNPLAPTIRIPFHAEPRQSSCTAVGCNFAKGACSSISSSTGRRARLSRAPISRSSWIPRRPRRCLPGPSHTTDRPRQASKQWRPTPAADGDDPLERVCDDSNCIGRPNRCHCGRSWPTARFSLEKWPPARYNACCSRPGVAALAALGEEGLVFFGNPTGSPHRVPLDVAKLEFC